MVTDISKWKIEDDGTIDTSEGDNVLNLIYEQDRIWRKEHKTIINPRKILTDKEKKQHYKEYQHNYYMQVTKIKRKQKKRCIRCQVKKK